MRCANDSSSLWGAGAAEAAARSPSDGLFAELRNRLHPSINQSQLLFSKRAFDSRARSDGRVIEAGHSRCIVQTNLIFDVKSEKPLPE
jgi:hypothetical protein